MIHVTVAICTWNRCEQLKRTLDALCHVEVPPDTKWEVIVGNNSCTDQRGDSYGDGTSAVDVAAGGQHEVLYRLGRIAGKPEKWIVNLKWASMAWEPPVATAGARGSGLRRQRAI